MKLFTVLGLIIAIVAVIFASQNSTNVAIHLLNLSYQAPMSLVVLLTLSAGILVGLFVSVPPMIGRMRRISSLGKRVEEQNKKIKELNRKLLEASEKFNFLRQRYGSRADQSPNNFPEMPVQ
jgi:uncharacterized integral membrane protein